MSGFVPKPDLIKVEVPHIAFWLQWCHSSAAIVIQVECWSSQVQKFPPNEWSTKVVFKWPSWGRNKMLVCVAKRRSNQYALLILAGVNTILIVLFSITLWFLHLHGAISRQLGHLLQAVPIFKEWLKVIFRWLVQFFRLNLFSFKLFQHLCRYEAFRNTELKCRTACKSLINSVNHSLIWLIECQLYLLLSNRSISLYQHSLQNRWEFRRCFGVASWIFPCVTSFPMERREGGGCCFWNRLSVESFTTGR